MKSKQQQEYRKRQFEETRKLAEELVVTSGQLKDMIEKAGQDTLPLQAIRKAEEIEALSKKIKSRLKGGG
ncbi:MAG: hypothetical protein PHX83_11220 [Acidobacteriia bacterium]|nr:hypothetical protein [Terriglobia bacterium]